MHDACTLVAYGADLQLHDLDGFGEHEPNGGEDDGCVPISFADGRFVLLAADEAFPFFARTIRRCTLAVWLWRR